MKKFNQLAKKKKNYLKVFLSRKKTKVAIKFPKKKLFFFFLPKISLALKGLSGMVYTVLAPDNAEPRIHSKLEDQFHRNLH